MSSNQNRVTGLDVTAITFGAATLLGGLLVVILTILIQGQALSYLPTAIAAAAFGVYVLASAARALIRIQTSQIVVIVFAIVFLGFSLTGVIGACVTGGESTFVAIPAGAIAAVATIVLVFTSWDIVRAQHRD